MRPGLLPPARLTKLSFSDGRPEFLRHSDNAKTRLDNLQVILNPSEARGKNPIPSSF